MIVPAAPCWESTFTAAVLSLQSGVEEVEAVEPVDSLEDDVEVEAEAPPVELDCWWEPCAVGTGPASFAPFPPHPPATAAKTTATAAAEKKVLVMGSIVGSVRNSSSLCP